MKKLLMVILTIAALTSLNAQGIKKQPKAEAKPKQEQPADSVVIKGTYRNDTAKVIAVLYVEDGTLTWVKGYVVVNSFVPHGGQPLTAGQVLYNSKFEAIRPEDVYDVKQVDWK